MSRLHTVLQFCHLPLLVSAVLLPPMNLTFTSQNFKHILTWEEPNNESVIFYNVEYQDNSGEYHLVTSCSSITTRLCDLSKEFTDIFSYYTARVQSFTPYEMSEKSKPSPQLEPISDTVVGPPVVDVVAAGSDINVSIRLPVSYLWEKSEERYVSIVKAYPAIDYEIHLEPSAKVPITIDAVSTESVTRPIRSLLPNTNYCVSVSMCSENMIKRLNSDKKCIVTRGPQSEGGNKLYWIALVMLFIIVLVILVILDRAGCICRKNIRTPAILTSVPESTHFFHGGDELISLVPTTPVEIVSSPNSLQRSLDSAPYMARNQHSDPEDLQEDHTCNTSSPRNGEPARDHSVLPLLELTGLTLSQDVTHLDNAFSTELPAGVTKSPRSMEVQAEDEGDGHAGDLLSNMSNIFKDLNSVSMADSNDHLPLIEDLDVFTGQPRGDPKDRQNARVQNPRLLAIECENSDDEDSGADVTESWASHYIKR